MTADAALVVRAIITEICREYHGTDIGLPDTKTLAAIGMDWLDAHHLVQRIEERFGIALIDSEMLDLNTTVGALISNVEQKVSHA